MKTVILSIFKDLDDHWDRCFFLLKTEPHGTSGKKKVKAGSSMLSWTKRIGSSYI